MCVTFVFVSVCMCFWCFFPFFCHDWTLNKPWPKMHFAILWRHKISLLSFSRIFFWMFLTFWHFFVSIHLFFLLSWDDKWLPVLFFTRQAVNIENQCRINSYDEWIKDLWYEKQPPQKTFHQFISSVERKGKERRSKFQMSNDDKNQYESEHDKCYFSY